MLQLSLQSNILDEKLITETLFPGCIGQAYFMEGMACSFVKDSANMRPTLVLLIKEFWSLLCECMCGCYVYYLCFIGSITSQSKPNLTASIEERDGSFDISLHAIGRV